MKLEKIGGGRKKKLAVSVVSWTGFFWFTILIFLTFSSFLLSVRKFSSVSSLRFISRQYHGDDEHQKLVVAASWPNRVISEEDPATILHAVVFPDQIAFFLNHPSPLAPDHVDCVYFSNSSVYLRPIHLHRGQQEDIIVVRCPPQPQHSSSSSSSATLRLRNPNHHHHQQQVILPSPSWPTYRWNWLSYESYLDQNDNTTIVFAKGFNLLRGRLYEPSRFSCIFSQAADVFHRSQVLSIGQEVVRCKTPLPILLSPHGVKVSVRLTGRVTLPSIANVYVPPPPTQPQPPRHEMCVCTMLRNQARFLKEWITYHSRIGVQRWFIYDNNSDDHTPSVVTSLNAHGHNITTHHWPWIKSQEAGFAHCALRARHHCKWVAFIDVDEFFHFPSSISPPSLHALLQNYSSSSSTTNQIGEIRTFCYTFGPSGHRKHPTHGVTLGYTCRMRAHERHKSIIRPDALSSDLVNVVHHFRLRDGFKSVTLDRPVMVINHYKYQVWEVFKDKFYRRVATYVSDWKDEVNTGSKDRAPGLGTKPVQPDDWPQRFCQVNDTGLRDWVLREFANTTHAFNLPWEEEEESTSSSS